MTDYRLLHQLFVVVVIAMLAAGCNPSNNGALQAPEDHLQADKDAITQLYSLWQTAVENGDREGYVNVLDEQVTMIAPGAADIVGRDAYAKFLIPVFQHAEYRLEFGEMQIDLLGDYALVRYDCVVHISMAEGVDKITDNQAALDQLVNKAKYLDVLKRQDAGEWKVYRHMWNDAPQDIGET
jgi:uncharacterized protein (TIGR02246 family)